MRTRGSRKADALTWPIIDRNNRQLASSAFLHHKQALCSLKSGAVSTGTQECVKSGQVYTIYIQFTKCQVESNAPIYACYIFPYITRVT